MCTMLSPYHTAHFPFIGANCGASSALSTTPLTSPTATCQSQSSKDDQSTSSTLPHQDDLSEATSQVKDLILEEVANRVMERTQRSQQDSEEETGSGTGMGTGMAMELTNTSDDEDYNFSSTSQALDSSPLIAKEARDRLAGLDEPTERV